MATTRIPRLAVALSGLALAVGAVAGCSSDSASDNNSSSTSTMTGMSSSAMAAAPVGSGCAAYAAANPTGPGSVEGMAMAPVATAAAANPELSTLTEALSGKLNPQVNLVDTLNNGQYTVFAPTNEAFAALPAGTLDKLKTDSALLTKILTYHVVSGQAAPDAVVGTHKTLEGQNVTVSGTPEALKVNTAGVVCGGVKTANAQVYMIDAVLMPPA